MKIEAESLEEYLSKLPPDRADVISVIRRKVSQLAPEAKEGLTYGMPSFELGNVLVCYGAQKHYYALYVGPETLSAFRDRMGSLNCGKSCIRFKWLEDIPEGLLDEILKAKIEEARGIRREN